MNENFFTGAGIYPGGPKTSFIRGPGMFLY